MLFHPVLFSVQLIAIPITENGITLNIRMQAKDSSGKSKILKRRSQNGSFNHNMTYYDKRMPVPLCRSKEERLVSEAVISTIELLSFIRFILSMAWAFKTGDETSGVLFEMVVSTRLDTTIIDVVVVDVVVVVVVVGVSGVVTFVVGDGFVGVVAVLITVKEQKGIDKCLISI